MGLQSMTGHGQAQRVAEGMGCLVELRGVNHRFLDVSIRGTALSFSLERAIREVISRTVERGRVDVVITALEPERSQVSVAVDAERVDQLLEAYRSQFERLGLSFDDRKTQQRVMLQILDRPDVFVRPLGVDTEGAAWSSLVLATLEEAVGEFLRSRRSEGDRLGLDIDQRGQLLLSFHADLCARAESVPERARDRLRQRLARLAGEGGLSEDRIAQEAAIIADRADITEELVRFAGHLDELKKTLMGGRVGRRLDFIVQELGREVNTIGSKAQDSAIQAIVIEIKGELERIREQVQNLE